MILRDRHSTETGTIRIHDNVIASIASLAALEIEGVREIDKSLKTGFLEILGTRRSAAIRIEKDDNGDISLTVPLVVKYGCNVPDVSGKVQENIRAALERMVNVVVREIVVNVQGVERG
ncbi:MAG: Asp23/Gls24 family envelope stress response protein [Candidatus Omnitrophica bacterium]|nr:Asp23/Gls24 family envelope stress response protein [Candidatus Omnitrophota bacterium]